MASFLFAVSCGKDKEATNNGIFTIEPVEEEEPPPPVTNSQEWSMRINGVLTEIDTALIHYSYQNNLHVFECNPGGNDLFRIKLPSLDSGLYVLDLDSKIIEYVQGGILYNGANSPQGVIHLYKNSNQKISLNYNARLFNLSSGQEHLITDGKMKNIPYTE